MKVEFHNGCFGVTVKVDGKSIENMPEIDLRAILHMIADNVPSHMLERHIQDSLSFLDAEHETDVEDCDQCGNWNYSKFWDMAHKTEEGVSE